MPRRHILSARQRSALLDLPSDEASLLRHYILADDDLIHIDRRRRPENRIGFALQLCALRYPGRMLAPGEVIPLAVAAFLGAQLGIAGDTLVRYAVRRQTRQQHMEVLRRTYGYRTFPGQGAPGRVFRDWLLAEAEQARSNDDLARRFIARCRDTMTILPAITTIERLCADALVAPERGIEKRIAARLDRVVCTRLDRLTTEMLPGAISRFIWLRRIEPGNNSAAANRLLDRLEFLHAIMGTTASADGQFYPAARQGEAMNTVNARYGNDPGIKAYTHVNDRFAPFASRTIPATVSEAPYLLDGLTMNEAGRRIEEQYADTGGFTDHLFGISAMLGYRLVLRIRDLPSKRLYVFDPAATPTELRPLVGGKAREALIVSNWPDLFRCAATMSAGQVAPSRILRKLAAYPRQNDLAAALREVGRVERTLFVIEWILDTGMQPRAQVGLNKGEVHHALKNALRIGRQGEIRDRSTEGQHYRIAGLNLLTAIIVYWNTLHLGHAVEARRREGLDTPDHLLAHVSPLGWAHILLTGEHLWPKDAGA